MYTSTFDSARVAYLAALFHTVSSKKIVFLDSVSRFSLESSAARNNSPWQTHTTIVGKLAGHAICFHDSRVRVVSRSCYFFHAINVVNGSFSITPSLFSVFLPFSSVNESPWKAALQLANSMHDSLILSQRRNFGSERRTKLFTYITVELLQNLAETRDVEEKWSNSWF